QQGIQAAVAQRQGQGAANHTGAHNDQIRLHVHSLGGRPQLRLEPDIKRLVNARDERSLRVTHLDLQLGQVFVTTSGALAYFVEQCLVDAEVRVHRALARCNEIDVRGLVPDNVVAAETFHD